MRNVQPAESFSESLFDPNWGHVPGNKVSGAPANNSVEAAFVHLKSRRGHTRRGTGSKVGMDYRMINRIMCPPEG